MLFAARRMFAPSLLIVLALIGPGCERAAPPPPTPNPGIAPTANDAQPSSVKPDALKPVAAKQTLLNVSYDPTREFYQAYNTAFAAHWLAQTGQPLDFEQSHGGSGKQSRAVIDGLEADIVTLSVALDIDNIAAAGLLDADWQKRLPHNSAPYASTIVFLVRPGNPKGIKDWDDLAKGDLQLVAANPKTGGGARWNYLAAWGYALKKELGSLDKLSDPTAKDEVAAAQEAAKKFVGEIYRRMASLDSGARGATNSFVQREIGDALLCWENEAFLTQQELGADKVEIVVPSISILAEPPVAVVDKNVDRRGTRTAAEAYLKHLYSAEGQTLAAKFHYRPVSPDLVPASEARTFAAVELFTLEQVFGSWPKAQAEHFEDGGIYDQMFPQ